MRRVAERRRHGQLVALARRPVRQGVAFEALHVAVIVVAVGHVVVHGELRLPFVEHQVEIVVAKASGHGIQCRKPAAEPAVPALDDVVDDGLHLGIAVAHTGIVDILHAQHLLGLQGHELPATGYHTIDADLHLPVRHGGYLYPPEERLRCVAEG